MIQKMFAGLLCAAVSASYSPAYAVPLVIDFEQFSHGTFIDENNSLVISQELGIRIDSISAVVVEPHLIPPDYAQNGTNWLVSNANTLIRITSDVPFDLISLDVTEWSSFLPAGNTVKVEGFGFGLPNREQNIFTTDGAQQSFQTFLLTSNFSFLGGVWISDPFGRFAIDNIVLDVEVPLPNPAALLLLGLGFAGIRIIRRTTP